MNAEDLRAMQAPLKSRYKETPDAAVITLKAEGDLDFRGTLGVDKTAPVGFRAIRLSFALDGDLDGEQKAQLLKLTERYCVVYQTLRAAPAIDVRMD